MTPDSTVAPLLRKEWAEASRNSDLDLRDHQRYTKIRVSFSPLLGLDETKFHSSHSCPLSNAQLQEKYLAPYVLAKNLTEKKKSNKTKHP